MKKGEVSVKPLVYFISFVLGLILVCIIGIKNTYALEYENLGNLVDITVLYASPDYTDAPIELPPNESLYLQEVKNLTYIVENYNFIANTHYQLESQLKGVTLTNANYYEVTDENGNNCLISYQYSILYGDYPRWNFQCPYNTNSVAISISNNNNEYLFDPGNFEWSTAVLSKTNTSINYDSTDTDNIINNNNQNTQDIINNNNENTDKIIESNKETQEVIKDQFNTCNQFDKNITNFTYGSISGSNGQNTSDSSTTRLRTDFFEVDSSKQYTISFLDDMVYQFYIFEYNSNKSFIKRVPPSSWGTNGFTFTTSSNTKYLRFVIRNSNDVVFDNLDIGTLNIKGEEICQNKLDEAEDTRKGIWQTIKELPNMFLDMLLGLFIPEDLSFINEFKDVISNKLGFIASVPIQIIDFTLNLANVAFEEITTISFPSISIFGFNFWNAEEIDITIILEKLKPFRYLTDLTCVILCCRTLYDMYHNFTGGGAN